MGELATETKQYSDLPGWVPTYLAAWGSTRPDGRRMTVRWASGLSGVDESSVRKLRGRSKMFERLEYLARHGGGEFMASYAEAGLRGAAPALLQAFLGLVEDGHPQVVMQGMKWLLARPEEVDVNLTGSMAQGSPQEWAELGDDEAGQVAANLQAALTVIGHDGSADVDDSAQAESGAEEAV